MSRRQELDALLRSEGRFALHASEFPLRFLVSAGIVGCLIYGFAMGLWDLRPLQGLYSSLKLPVLTGVSMLICIPNYYVLNMVLGLSADFKMALRAVALSQCVSALTLAALSPLILTIYASSTSYHFVMACNGLLFLMATLVGHFRLRKHYRPLVAKNAKHRTAIRAWLTLYVFVAIQMAWLLRPYVGDPNTETTFFRKDAWDNAYVILMRDLFGHFVP